MVDHAEAPENRRVWDALSRMAVTALLVLGAFLALRIPLRDAEAWVHDRLVRWSAAGAGDPVDPMAIVAIDDASIAEFGRFPWPRTRLADLIDRMREAGARAVVLDVLLCDRTNAADDSRLAAALRSAGNVVLAGSGRIGSDFTPGSESGLAGALSLPRVDPDELILPVPEFAEAAAATGYAGALLEPDGVLRRYPLAVRAGTRAIPSLAVAVHALVRGEDGAVAIDERGSFPIDFAGFAWERLPVLSCGEVLSGTIVENAPRIRGRVIFVCATYTGGIDQGHTPLSENSPLGPVHAYAYHTISRGTAPRELGSTATLAAMALVILLHSLPTAQRTPARLAAFTAGTTLALGIGAVLAYLMWRVRFDPVSPTCAALAALGHGSLAAWARDLRARALFSRTLRRYVAGHVVRVLESCPGMIPSARHVESTVLFCDLTGFTRLADTADAEQVVELLNAYHAAMLEQIESQGGVIDKIMGDGIMAYWTAAPGADEAPPAAQAVKAALSMLAAVQPLNASLHARGLPECSIHVGVATGRAVWGEIGSPRFRNLTLIGRVVNLAQRLEAAARPGQILISEATHDLASGILRYDAFPTADLALKGYDALVTAYCIGEPATVFAPRCRIETAP